ncbi:MAG: amidohydrolase family protein, partial [Cyclobacteriaceae bacterium]
LQDALAKMTLLPAQVLEDFAPSMKNKGRIQVGTDADITIFNPETIIDNATFEEGLAFSTGVEYVLVSGKLVLKDGETIPDVFPGKPIYGQFRR